jgi:hypothetical protein
LSAADAGRGAVKLTAAAVAAAPATNVRREIVWLIVGFSFRWECPIEFDAEELKLDAQAKELGA